MPRSAIHTQVLSRKLKDDDAFATTLLAICLDEYGAEMLDWSPEALWISIAEDFNVQLSRVNKDKIQALTLTYTTDIPFVSVEAFSNLCNVFSGAEANFQKWDLDISANEMIWAVYEMMLNVGIGLEHGETPPEFSHEVRRFMGVVLDQEGITDPPDILRMAEMESRANIDQWSDDATMFHAAWSKSRDEKARIMETLKYRLTMLLSELNELPIEKGDNWSMFKRRIEKNLLGAAKEESQAEVAAHT